MKPTAYFIERRIVRPALLLLALFSARCDRAAEPRYVPPPEELNSIAYLKSLCPRNGSAAVAQDIVVEGVVTGNDRFGEFRKTLVVEDATGGITIAVDGTSLADDYPFGAAVTVHCNGLTLRDYGGKAELGGAPGDGYDAGLIPAEEIGRYLRRNPANDRMPRPAALSFGQVAAEHTDRLVRFDGVRFADEGCYWCDTDPETLRPVTTERTILDDRGGHFAVRTLGSCAYATEPVPSGTGSLWGVIDYFDGRFSLRVTAMKIAFPPASTAATPPRAYPSTAGY